MVPKEEKAFRAAFHLLKFRMRSVSELRERLLRKDFDEDVVNKVISKLEQKNYLNDKTFAEALIKSRMKKNYGALRIKRELLQKGVSKELIETEFEKLKPEENLEEFAQKKLSSYRGLDPEHALQRLNRNLLQRGFTPDLVYEACEKLRQKIAK